MFKYKSKIVYYFDVMVNAIFDSSGQRRHEKKKVENY